MVISVAAKYQTLNQKHLLKRIDNKFTAGFFFFFLSLLQNMW